ncbi:hypothetical protein MLD38_011664 [Melastoma candidum]|uniref:Uncharacterized protein n=1 Tax=Melastoma candidum TaxID=119954 RepID=A0ACB9R7X6_9MYRT|nr:hypothetical protein MLD38_011664 [Melastoma candidum]
MGEIADDGAAAENGKKGGKGDGNGNGKPNALVVLKVDLHCRGCVTKILKHVRGFEGVVDAKVEKEANKLTVEGKVDAARLQEMLQAKTKKKVEILPVPQQKQQQTKKKKKEDEEEEGGKDTNGNEDGKCVDNNNIKSGEKKSGEKKAKEPPVTTVVIKLGGLDCQGCVAKINKIIAKTPGVQDFTVDKDKEVATVKGTVDPKGLVDNLREKMRRSVEIVPPQKKEKDREKEKEKEKGKGKEEGGGGGKKKGGGVENNGGGGKMEGSSRMEYYYGGGAQAGGGLEPRVVVGGDYPYGVVMYGEQVHAPQLFSDENPNACCVM